MDIFFVDYVFEYFYLANLHCNLLTIYVYRITKTKFIRDVHILCQSIFVCMYVNAPYIRVCRFRWKQIKLSVYVSTFKPRNDITYTKIYVIFLQNYYNVQWYQVYAFQPNFELKRQLCFFAYKTLV